MKMEKKPWNGITWQLKLEIVNWKWTMRFVSTLFTFVLMKAWKRKLMLRWIWKAEEITNWSTLTLKSRYSCTFVNFFQEMKPIMIVPLFLGQDGLFASSNWWKQISRGSTVASVHHHNLWVENVCYDLFFICSELIKIFTI